MDDSVQRGFEPHAAALRQLSADADSAPTFNISIYRVVHAVIGTAPYGTLLTQAIWTSLVVTISHTLSRNNYVEAIDSVSSSQPQQQNPFWMTRVSVPASVPAAVGWALFILLSLLIRHSSDRYFSAQYKIRGASSALSRAARLLRLSIYPDPPPTTTSPSTTSSSSPSCSFSSSPPSSSSTPCNTSPAAHATTARIAAYLAAFHVALRLTLRRSRDPTPLALLLHPDDVADVISADIMHIHCLRVVRAYFRQAAEVSEEHGEMEDEGTGGDERPEIPRMGEGVMRILASTLDEAEHDANDVVRIAQFYPSVPYVNHLRIFLYIWLGFLPMALVSTSGWYTIVWSLLITYGVSMIFYISLALNDPFGDDLFDIALIPLCARFSRDLLTRTLSPELSPKRLMDAKAALDTPDRLSPRVDVADLSEEAADPIAGYYTASLTSPLKRVTVRRSVFILVLLYMMWAVAVLVGFWLLTRDIPRVDSDRWYSFHVPIDNDVTSYVSLGVFLLLGFWLSDAYSRYSIGLLQWTARIHPQLEHISFLLGITFRSDAIHPRDGDRLMAHLASLPLSEKQHLRHTRDETTYSTLLAQSDAVATVSVSNGTKRALDVVHAYVLAADAQHPPASPTTMSTNSTTLCMTLSYLRDMEDEYGICEAIQNFPISPAFTIHLYLFTGLWLAVLPSTLMLHDGFLSLLYLAPISFSLIKLLSVGEELSDPFGNDIDDIPLGILAAEMSSTIQTTHEQSSQGPSFFAHESKYNRASFTPKCKAAEKTQSDSHSKEITGEVISSFRRVCNMFPAVPFLPLLISSLWSIVATIASSKLSKLWDDERQNECAKWCSFLDVDGKVLANIGFAVFLILAFRASDGIRRYEQGAMTMYDLDMNLKALAEDAVQSFRDGAFHNGEKDRIVAHLVQIPFTFRDLLLGVRSKVETEYEGMLSEDDLEALENSVKPLDFLLKTVETYFISSDISEVPSGKGRVVSYSSTFIAMTRVSKIRTLMSEVISVKRFPVIASYTRHQYLFTCIWLAFLPFSMTAQSGFLTMFWAPLISYGVLGLENIAVKLIDPFGNDATDLPVDKMCRNTANAILDAVNSSKWTLDGHVYPSPVDSNDSIGIQLIGNEVFSDYRLPVLERTLNVDDKGKFDMVGEPMMKPSLYSHILRSVPVWMISVVTLWSVTVCVISFATRINETENVRWWSSQVSVSTDVATYVSFAAFSVLGFFVHASFGRYHRAGGVWGDHLRGLCHSLTGQLMSLLPMGSLHEDDHRRVVGHIAALPIVLKQELRNCRDCRELKGLLSKSDISNIQFSMSMSSYTISVIRAYFRNMMEAITVPDNATSNVPFSWLFRTISDDIVKLEGVVQTALFLNSVPLAPGFLALLHALLFLWFAIIPLVLVEISGWFTILWVSIIAYGILGMYKVATELQNPFGNDLNDLDLSTMAHDIVADIVDTYQNFQARGPRDFACIREVQPAWSPISLDDQRDRLDDLCYAREKLSSWNKFTEGVRLASHTLSPLTTSTVIFWSGAVTAAAYIAAVFWPVSEAGKCNMGFCSYIAVDDSVKTFPGFALFLLLGFRLNDSHERYVRACEIWQGGIVGTSRLFTNRIFAAFKEGTWHDEDFKRIAGFVCAFPVCLMGSLRDVTYEEKLYELLSKEDVSILLKRRTQPDYCLDVLRAYVVHAEKNTTKQHLKTEAMHLLQLISRLSEAAQESQRMLRIPMPFGYVQHMRIFLRMWIMLLPLGLVESCGWLSIMWTIVVAYGVIGIEHWAAELSDPFGFDVSDVPLENLCERVLCNVKTNLQMFRTGAPSLVRDDRAAFPVVD